MNVTNGTATTNVSSSICDLDILTVISPNMVLLSCRFVFSCLHFNGLITSKATCDILVNVWQPGCVFWQTNLWPASAAKYRAIKYVDLQPRVYVQTARLGVCHLEVWVWVACVICDCGFYCMCVDWSWLWRQGQAALPQVLLLLLTIRESVNMHAHTHTSRQSISLTLH